MSEELPQDATELAGVKEKSAPKHPAWLPFAIDFGPLLVFFLTYRLTRSDAAFGDTAGAIKGTAAFMIASLIAIAVSQWKLKKISPILWISTIIVIGFGAITIIFGDERYIVMKPTVTYGGLGALLVVAWLMNKPLLKYVLEAAYDGLSEDGWLKISRNWGFFFLAMALANHIMYEMFRAGSLAFGTWLSIKSWAFIPVSIIFAMTQVPLMMRHGLTLGDDAK